MTTKDTKQQKIQTEMEKQINGKIQKTLMEVIGKMLKTAEKEMEKIQPVTEK